MPQLRGRRVSISFETQLAVYLKMLGSSGNASSPRAISELLRISVGSFYIAIKRIRELILCLKSEALFWPGISERNQISQRIANQYKLPGCIGSIDGTLFRFASRPAISNAEDYFDRKSGYILNAIVINDDKRRIRHIQLGWPGSVHDQRAHESSEVVRHSENFFRHRQDYLTGDSAFTPSMMVIPVFKKPKGSSLTEIQEAFNRQISIWRVSSEHTIGILKGRFQWLKAIGSMFRNNDDLKKIIHTILTAVILN